MYVENPNELDQLLVTAEANHIAHEIPEMRAGGAVPDSLRGPSADGTQRAFLIHEQGGGVLARFDDGDVKVADDAPISFVVIRTERDTWGARFLLSGTRRVNVEHEPYWVTVAISGHGFQPFIPVIFNEIRFHVIFPLVLLSLMFLLFNFSVVRSTLKPLQATIAAVDRIDPAQIATRIEPEASSQEAQALVSSVNRLLERVERAVRALRDFAGDAAHELRTPLAIMMLSIGKLSAGPEKSKLLFDAQGMRRLVDQMLDLSQATALEFNVGTRANLSAIAADVATELTPLAVAHGRSIVFRDAGAAVVPGHAEAIGRALRNSREWSLPHTARDCGRGRGGAWRGMLRARSWARRSPRPAQPSAGTLPTARQEPRRGGGPRARHRLDDHAIAWWSDPNRRCSGRWGSCPSRLPQ